MEALEKGHRLLNGKNLKQDKEAQLNVPTLGDRTEYTCRCKGILILFTIIYLHIDPPHRRILNRFEKRFPVNRLEVEWTVDA